MLHVKLNTKELVGALNAASAVLEKRNVNSDLGNIKLESKNNALYITSTDLDMYLYQSLSCEVFSESAIAIPGRVFYEIIQKNTNDEIIIQQINDNQVEIKSHNCEFKLPAFTSLNLHSLPHTNSKAKFAITIKHLLSMMEYTVFSIISDENRYNLNGIFLHTDENNIYTASVDGHRLSCTQLEQKYVDWSSDINTVEVIIPKKAVNEIIRLSKNFNSDEKVIISIDNSRIEFTFHNSIFISKLIDGKFPNYKKFIPTDNDNVLTINTNLLFNIVQRVSVVTVDKFRAIKINIDLYLELSASGQNKGLAYEKVLLSSSDKESKVSFDGNNVDIVVNPNYILDVLSVLKNQEIKLYLKNNQTGILIQPSEKSHDVQPQFVIMPVGV